MLEGDVPFETEDDIVAGHLPFETEITPGKLHVILFEITGFSDYLLYTYTHACLITCIENMRTCMLPYVYGMYT